jgi:ATP adenylyltransferase
MDRLWSPWRYQYVQKTLPDQGCVFCNFPKENWDEERFIVHRAQFNFVILNIYPYTTGHLMVVPFQHVSTLGDAAPEALQEMMLIARQAEHHLTEVYRPNGMNVGLNLGEAAGAGIASHLHLHVVPRWIGDSNFMTVLGETRVLPEDLAETYRKLKAVWL